VSHSIEIEIMYAKLTGEISKRMLMMKECHGIGWITQKQKTTELTLNNWNFVRRFTQINKSESIDDVIEIRFNPAPQIDGGKSPTIYQGECST
jgi:hypothetical protein